MVLLTMRKQVHESFNFNDFLVLQWTQHWFLKMTAGYLLTPLTTGSNLLTGNEVLLLAIAIVAFLPNICICSL